MFLLSKSQLTNTNLNCRKTGAILILLIFISYFFIFMAAQQNNNNPNFADLNSIFSAAFIMSHNPRSLNSSDPHSHSKCPTKTFLQSNTILLVKSVKVLHLQEVGQVWLPQILFHPDLKLAAYSVDDNNVFASTATYYCHRR